MTSLAKKRFFFSPQCCLIVVNDIAQQSHQPHPLSASGEIIHRRTAIWQTMACGTIGARKKIMTSI